MLFGKGDFILLDYKPVGSAQTTTALKTDGVTFKKYITEAEKNTLNEIATHTVLDTTDGVPQVMVEIEEKNKIVSRDFLGQQDTIENSYKLSLIHI